jgi:predicted protein tyrosine phosphatase
MPSTIKLAISSRDDAHHHLAGDFSHSLSLLDPERGYAGLPLPRSVKHSELLMFHDLDDIEAQHKQFKNYNPPVKEHIKVIIDMFRHMRARRGSGIVVHCEAGISRSTAASIIGLCTLGIEPKAAFEHVVSINEFALPNRRMLRLAGSILKDNGQLSAIAEARRAELFAKHSQCDPTEKLRGEIRTGIFSRIGIRFKKP